MLTLVVGGVMPVVYFLFLNWLIYTIFTVQACKKHYERSYFFFDHSPCGRI